MNKNKLKLIIAYFSIIRFIPHLVCLMFSNNKIILEEDAKFWIKCLGLKLSGLISILYLLRYYKEFRSLFYYRIPYSKAFKMFANPIPNLYICCDSIGKGLFLQHGFATILTAKSIGEYCWINQQVTLGWAGKGVPVVGSHVRIGAGAIIIGSITVGNNSIIGAGSVVVKDVPENSTIVGSAAKVIKIKE
jgi:serine O-acetyltransferase